MTLTLFAAEGGSLANADLFRFIDPSTGEGVVIGQPGYAITGIAGDPTDGTVYAVTSNNSPASPRSLLTLVPLGASATPVGALGLGSLTCSDISFNSAGDLYGIRSGANTVLVRINKTTGAGTVIGTPTALFGGACEFINDVLYWIPQSPAGGDISTIDLVTGVFTPVVAMQFPANGVNGAAYNPDTGLLYASTTGSMFLVNWLTGETAATAAAPPITMDALAWLDVALSVRVSDPPLWRLIVTDLDTGTLTILDHRSTDRQFTFVLDGPAQHTGLVASDDPEINLPYPDADSPPYLNHNTRLIYGLRRETRANLLDAPWVCRFGGIVMQVEDVAADTPTTRYTAYDPWQYLYSRPARDQAGNFTAERGIVYQDARPSDIALELLENTELLDGPTFIYINPANVEDSDVLDGLIEFERGISVGEAWDRLCATGYIDIELRPVYDPLDLDGKQGFVCELHIHKVLGGTTPTVRFNAVFAWDKPGHSITEMSRLIDGTQLANSIQFYAGQGGVPVAQQLDADSILKYGVYWGQAFLTGQLRQGPSVAAQSIAEVLLKRDGNRTITFNPAPERSVLPLRDYKLGEYVPVWSSRNMRDPIGVDYDAYQADPDFPGAAGYQRVYAIPITLDDNGVERVTGVLTSKDTAIG